MEFRTGNKRVTGLNFHEDAPGRGCGGGGSSLCQLSTRFWIKDNFPFCEKWASFPLKEPIVGFVVYVGKWQVRNYIHIHNSHIYFKKKCVFQLICVTWRVLCRDWKSISSAEGGFQSLTVLCQDHSWHELADTPGWVWGALLEYCERKKSLGRYPDLVKAWALRNEAKVLLVLFTNKNYLIMGRGRKEPPVLGIACIKERNYWGGGGAEHMPSYTMLHNNECSQSLAYIWSF